MAIYTQLSDSQIIQFVRSYDLGMLKSATGIAQGVENTNYLLTLQSGERAILTLFEKRTRQEDLPFYMELMAHLSDKGVHCPQPYIPNAVQALGITEQGEAAKPWGLGPLRPHSKKNIPHDTKPKNQLFTCEGYIRHDGAMISELAGRPAVIVSFLQGREITRIQPLHLAELGREMARMHLAAQDFPQQKPNDFAPDQLGALYRKTASRLDELQAEVSRKIAEDMDVMQQWRGLGLPRGVIHADLFPDNVFFTGKKLSGIIDFYFACTDYLAYDLAICLNAWCFESDDHFSQTKANAMLAAYEQRRRLSDAEKRALPLLARGAALRFLLTRAHDWFFRVEDAVVTPKDPLEYLRKWEYWRSL